jgi:hypothetical protein
MNREIFVMWTVRGITCAAILLCMPGSALGQPTSAEPSSDAATADAISYYELGLAAARQEKWERAKDLFDEAWRRKQHYQIAANLGMAELKLGKYKDAAIHLTYYLKNARGMNQADWEQGQAMLKEARANIGAVDIIVDRPDVEVFVDGKSIGRSPVKGLVFVDPGLCTVSARLEAERLVERVVHMGPGSQRRVELRSERVPAQPTTTSDDVILPESGSGPTAPKESPPPTLPDRSSVWRNTPVILFAGITGAALGVGIASTVHANKLSTRRDNIPMEGSAECNTCGREFTALSQAASDWSNYAVQWFIGAGVAAAGTGVLLMLRPRAEADERQDVRLSLRVSPGAVGIQGVW